MVIHIRRREFIATLGGARAFSTHQDTVHALLALRRINALDSLFRDVLGIPIHSGRDVL
jgi:hypothetical protein